MVDVIHRLFNNLAIRKTLLRLRYGLVLAVIVIVAYFMKPQWWIAAFLVSMVGELVQLWAFASLIKNKELAVRGPYVLTRNPMYLGRFFLILGLLLLPANLYLLIAYCVLYYFYMVNRVAREEQHLRQVLGQPYTEYCLKVNRFWPTLSRLGNKDILFFDWKRLIANNGHWNFLLTLIVYAALLAYALYLTAH
jgi:protein-S-isoprenylcysteine O-methyltransferase Ste14